MLKILKKLSKILNSRQKKSMILLVFLMLLGAVLEMASIGLLIPAVSQVMNPEFVDSNQYVAFIYQTLGFRSVKNFTIFMMLSLIFFFILKNCFLFFQTKMQLKFVYTNQFATSRRLMINFMKRPYEFYLGADTAVIQRSITSDVNNMYGLVLGLLQLMSEVFVFIGLAFLCIVSSPVISLVFFAIMIIILAIIKFVLQPIMKRAGSENQEYYSGLFKWINQSVTGIKEIKVAVKEHYFINEYAKCGKGYVNAVQRYNLFTATPRLLIETIAIIMIILYMLTISLKGMVFDDYIPILAAIGVAVMRMIPCANRINNHLTSIAYFEPFFMGVSDNLQAEINDQNINYDEDAYEKEYQRRQMVPKMKIKEQIKLSNITFKYPGTEVLIFDQAEMTIPIGKAVGIVGTSGAGKTTVVDIMLGLFKLQSGKIQADGNDVNENYDSWLKNIGYIPQTLFMIDDTIRCNIAFGISADQIDDDKVWFALREAQLEDFVKGLPEGLDTGIGERGIRLSGGQRQRIGIARALYEDPDILVLDEATAALDNETESAIMDSINRLHGRKTLVIIAHRLQTIEKCDIIYRIENGKALLIERSNYS